MLDFEAAWTLTIQNIRRGIHEPVRPEQIREVARWAELQGQPQGRRPSSG